MFSNQDIKETHLESEFGMSMRVPALKLLSDDLVRLSNRVDKILPGIVKRAAKIMEEELENEIERQGLIDTGFMKNTIASELIREFDPVIADIYVVPYYSYYLEYGVGNHQAYKFGRKAWARAAPKIAKYIDQQVKMLTQDIGIKATY